MACAAFAFLVPLTALLVRGLLLHLAFGFAAIFYLNLTWRSAISVPRYLKQSPPDAAWAEIDFVYFLPTLGLFALTIYPSRFFAEY